MKSEVNINTWTASGRVSDNPVFLEDHRIAVFSINIENPKNLTSIKIKQYKSQFEFLKRTLKSGMRVAVTGSIVNDEREESGLVVNAQKVILL